MRDFVGFSLTILGSLLLLGRPMSAAVPTPDPGFGSGGTVATPFEEYVYPQDVLMQADGSILVAGYPAAPEAGVLLRYLPDGSLDPAFGTEGRASAFPIRRANAAALQNDGKIVVVGGGYGPLVARLEVNGELDTSFGIDGSTSIPTVFYVSSVAIQSDGRIIVGGGALGLNHRFDSAVIRLLPDGSLDPGFGYAGIALFAFDPDDDRPFAVAVQPDGKIICAGSVGYPGTRALLFRLESDGALDASFGAGGVTLPPSLGGFSIMHLEADGRITCAGDAVARFDSNGVRDLAFADEEGITFPGSDGIAGLVETPDGKYHITGQAYDGQILVARYLQDGSRDPAYGTAGWFSIPFPLTSVADMTLQSDGKVVILGGIADDSYPYEPQYALVRLDAPVCGDGDVEDGEPCDDDNLLDGDGCDHSCLIEPCHWCSGNPSACGLGPRPTCVAPGRPDKSNLSMVDAVSGRDNFKWGWSDGLGVVASDLGNPGDLDEEYLCLFSGDGATVVPLPGGGQCGTKPCWTQKATYVSYQDRGSRDAIERRMTFRFGSAGHKAQMSFKMRGPDVPFPTLPVSLPLTVELQRPTGQCWSATYTAEIVTVNDGRKLRGPAAY